MFGYHIIPPVVVVVVAVVVCVNSGVMTALVDIYNPKSGQWTTATLLVACYRMPAATVEDVALIAGGSATYMPGIPLNTVDIFNVTSSQWTTTTLSIARDNYAAVSIGNKTALFATGYNT